MLYRYFAAQSCFSFGYDLHSYRHCDIVMFEAADWDEDCGPQLSALTWGVAKSQQINEAESKNAAKCKDKKNKSSKLKKHLKQICDLDDKFAMKKVKVDKNESETKKSSKHSSESSLKNVKKSPSDKSRKISRKISDKLGRGAVKTVDRLLNTPGATVALLTDTVTEKSPHTGSSLGLGSILTRGVKFSSTEAFLRFVGLPTKGKRGGKRSRSALEVDVDLDDSTQEDVKLKTQQTENVLTQLTGTDNVETQQTGTKNVEAQLTGKDNVETQQTGTDNVETQQTGTDNVGTQQTGTDNVEAQQTGMENEAFKADTPKTKNVCMTTSTPVTSLPPSKKRKLGGLDITKLREHLATKPSNQVSPSPSPVRNSLADSAKQKLSASRFRYLNEQLYCQEGSASASLFKNDSSLFSSYHAGYQIQARQWPIDPLNIVIAEILKFPDSAVVVDFGCGEARLASSVPNVVHSFDLVAANERVVACDMSKVPLESSSADVAVFCLSLMGTNIRDFIFEASRVLKVSGTMKIAELESRFQGEEFDVDKFVSDVEKFGFKICWKDLKKDFFYFLDFQKVKDVKKKKLPEIVLKPCLYKKR